MVTLKPEQEKLIAELTAARTTLEATYANISSAAEQARAVAREPVVALVTRALEAGIPARQVALRGLKYADVGSLKQFTTAAQTAQVLAALPALNTPPKPYEFRLEWADEREDYIDIYDDNGKVNFVGLGVMVNNFDAMTLFLMNTELPHADEINAAAVKFVESEGKEYVNVEYRDR